MRSSCILNVTMQFWSNSIVASNKLHYSIQTLVTSNTPVVVGELEWNHICLCSRVEATTVECCTSIIIITLQVKNEDGYTKQINLLTQSNLRGTIGDALLRACQLFLFSIFVLSDFFPRSSQTLTLGQDLAFFHYMYWKVSFDSIEYQGNYF
jgi:hypothetical protein